MRRMTCMTLGAGAGTGCFLYIDTLKATILHLFHTAYHLCKLDFINPSYY